jgi:hypothetical protein
MKERADEVRRSAGSTEKSKPDMLPTAVDTPVETQALDTPPNPMYHSGIFSIVIVGLFDVFIMEHLLKPLPQSNINNLENQNVMGRMGRSMKQIAGRPGQPTADDTELEEHADLPNSYCEIIVSPPYSCRPRDIDVLQINDDLIYRTRTKEMTSAPYVGLPLV